MRVQYGVCICVYIYIFFSLNYAKFEDVMFFIVLHVICIQADRKSDDWHLLTIQKTQKLNVFILNNVLPWQFFFISLHKHLS